MNTNAPAGAAMTNAKSQKTGYAGCPSRNQNRAKNAALTMTRSNSHNSATTSASNLSEDKTDGSGPLPSSPAYLSDCSTSAHTSCLVAGTTPDQC